MPADWYGDEVDCEKEEEESGWSELSVALEEEHDPERAETLAVQREEQAAQRD